MNSPFFNTHFDSFTFKSSFLNKPKKEFEPFGDSTGFQNNYDDLTVGNTADEDIEHVKGLDVWNVPPSTKAKAYEPGFINSKRVKEYRQKNKQEGGLPHVKTELINRILASQQDEIKASHIQSDRYNEDEDGMLPIIRREGEGTLKRYEATKMAFNEELIHELVIKKMREQINIDIISKMGQTQLKLYIKSIAEDAVAHFKSLKGILSPKLIQNYVQAALEMVRESRSGIIAAPKMTKEVVAWSHVDKPVNNYDAKEMMLVREYEFSVKQAKELRALVADLGHQLFKAKKEKAYYDDKLNQVRADYREIVKGTDAGQGSGRYTQRRTAVTTPSMVKDHMQTKKLKDEKKSEENQIVKALGELEETQKNLNIELRQAENELKTTKSVKTSCQIQLKKLYYEVLKDEEALIRGTENSKSYAWVVRALWNLGEDIKEDAFPLFLDSKAHEFLIAIAKCQEELEIHCRQHNLSTLLNNLKGFKPLNSMLQNKSDRNQPLTPYPETATVDTVGSHNELDSEQKLMTKSFHLLMTEYRERAFELKKVNLKVRKPAQQSKSYSANKSNNGPKWEEVDPRDLAAYGIEHPGAHQSKFDDSRKGSLPKLSTVGKPLEKALDILSQLEELRKDAAEKLMRTYMSKVLDERTKLDLQKTFRFIFGREEGDHFFFKLVTEKKFAEEKIGASIKKIKTKTATGSNELLTPLKMSRSPTEMRSASSINLRKGVELFASPSIKRTNGFL